MTTDQMFEHITRMQKIIMEPNSYITREDWVRESEEEQRGYYDWMRKQFNEDIVDLI